MSIAEAVVVCVVVLAVTALVIAGHASAGFWLAVAFAMVVLL